jgi:predicted nucleotidyltransferase
MMVNKYYEILNDLKELLSNTFPNLIEKVILFGSRSTGKEELYSDYDILIILNADYDWKLEDKIISLCYEIDLKYDILTDVKVISKNELNTIKGKQPFVRNAIEQGIEI